MSNDTTPHYLFTSKSRLDKAINSLLGIMEGIAADANINDQEMDYLAQWIVERDQYQSQHPFNELIPVVSNALKDGILSQDERDDITWLCEKLHSTEYFDIATAEKSKTYF